MSDIKPYINQHQSWGKDLLNRLNNLGNEYGGFNVWEELPIEGKDGEPLGTDHRGLTGILTTGEASIMQWDGESWTNLLSSPFDATGDPVPVLKISVTSTSKLTVADEGLESNYFYVIETGPSIVVSRYNKTTGTLLWTANIPFQAGQVFARTWGFDGLSAVDRAEFDGQNIYVQIQEFSVTSPISSDTATISIFALRLVDGFLLWKQALYSGALSTGPSVVFRNGGDFLYGIPYALNTIFKITKSSGSFISNTFTSIQNNLALRRVFFDESTQRIFLLGFRSGTITIERFSTSLENLGGLVVSAADTLLIGFFWSFIDAGKIYTWGQTIAGLQLYRYNCTTNTVETIGPFSGASLLTSTGWFLAKKVVNNIISCFAPAGSATRRLIINLSDKSISSESFLVTGDGVPSTTIKKDILSDTEPGNSVFFLLKEKVDSFGFGVSGFFSGSISIAGGTARILAINDAFIAYNKADIKGDVNSVSFYAETGEFGTLRSNSLRLSSSATPLASSERHRASGIYFDRYFSLYSLMGSTGTLASAGYTGVGAGAYTSGLLWGCIPLNGSLVATDSVLHPGAFIHDPNINKFFLENSGLVGSGSVVTSFPNGSGLVLASNNLGLGTATPAHKGDVVGTFRATTLMNSGGTVTSDERIKVGILPLEGLSLWEVCEELEAISFLYEPNFSFVVHEKGVDEDGNEVIAETIQSWPLPQGIQYGWSAQKIRDLFPELVTEDDQSGILYLNREALFPIFQSAATAKIRQLEESIAQKDTLLTQLQSAIESLTARVEALENAAA
jgi:hypothetical protein